MRWALYAVVILSIILALGGLSALIIVAIKFGTIDWFGFAAFIGAITTLVGVGITGKVIQKKEEAKFDSGYYKPPETETS